MLNLSISPPLVRHTGRAKESALQEADMTQQHKSSQRLRFIVGAAVIALGLVMLFGTLDEPAAHLTNLLGTAASGALELLPYFLPVAWQALEAYAFDHLRFSPCALHMLVSFWPLLHVLAGANLVAGSF
jgi:hypothetical protein